MNLFYIILASLGVMAISLSGILFAGQALRGWAERNLKFLTSLATGVFIFVAYNLIIEIGESDFSIPTLIGLLVGGLFIAFLLDKFIPDSHHHHGSGEEPHSHSPAGAQRILLSDTLHNVTDGLLLVSAFAVDVRLGFVTAIGVAIHELAQEISEYFVYRSAGYSSKKALTYNLVSASAILIGAFGGFFVLAYSESLITALLAVAAGIIIYTILRDLIPNSYQHAKRDQSFVKHLIAIFLGILIVFGVSLISADPHAGEDDHGDEDIELHLDE